MAASGQPALGDLCRGASRNITAIAARPPPTRQISPPASRAGIQFIRSSSRAAAQPNSAKRSLRCPIIESAVLTAL